jgi:hypothetical protein
MPGIAAHRIRSVPAVGHPFRFPFDLSLSPTPTSNQATDAHAFLHIAGPTNQFAEQVFCLLTEECRAIHHECANESCSPIAYAIGDLVMAKIQVNSDVASGTVAKLAYRKDGPYEIIESTGYGAYIFRRHGHPTAPLLKYLTQALSPLPLALLPCTPIDTPDFCYLNHSHSPLPHLLRFLLNIQMYINMWLPSSLPTDHPPLFKFCNVADTDAPASPPLPFHLPMASIPAAAAAVPISNYADPSLPPPHATGASLHAAISSSADRLFFVLYQPAATLRPFWYLVQVDLPQFLNVSPACVPRPTPQCYFTP